MCTRNLGLLMTVVVLCLHAEAGDGDRGSWSAEVEIFPAGEFSLPEYGWEWGRFRGSGLFRAAYEADGLVYATGHFVDYVPFRRSAGFLAFGMEYGQSVTGTLVEAAPKLAVTATPFVGSMSRVVFKELSVSRYFSVVRKGSCGLAPNQVNLGWETQTLVVWKVRALSEGFSRLPSGQTEAHLWAGNAWMWQHHIAGGIGVDVHDRKLVKFGIRVSLKKGE